MEDVCQTISGIIYNQNSTKTGTSGLSEKANPISVDERKMPRNYEAGTYTIGKAFETDEAPPIFKLRNILPSYIHKKHRLRLIPYFWIKPRPTISPKIFHNLHLHFVLHGENSKTPSK